MTKENKPKGAQYNLFKEVAKTDVEDTEFLPTLSKEDLIMKRFYICALRHVPTSYGEALVADITDIPQGAAKASVFFTDIIAKALLALHITENAVDNNMPLTLVKLKSTKSGKDFYTVKRLSE